jgi:hypothetical protein
VFVTERVDTMEYHTKCGVYSNGKKGPIRSTAKRLPDYKKLELQSGRLTLLSYNGPSSLCGSTQPDCWMQHKKTRSKVVVL